MQYYKTLQWIHQTVKPETYIEIGVRQGESWRYVNADCTSIGIDPAPDMQFDPPGKAQLFVGTSDDFFAQHNAMSLLGDKPCALSFIDGMHLFEFALRDFIALEAASGPDSTILIHDCLPLDASTSSRERKTDLWSGDPWKLIVCLKMFRPDLHVSTIDVAPTGLGVVRNLDPKSTVLKDRMDDILKLFVDMPYAALGSEWQKRMMLNVVDNNEAVLKALWRPRFASTAVPAATAPAARDGIRHKPQKPQLLGVLMCYNDADILDDAIKALLDSDHKIIAWDHGSVDGTAKVLDRYASELLERRFVPRDVDFYNLYEMMSRHLLAGFTKHYDWVSWPDQDEILEGPDRIKTYKAHLLETLDSAADWIEFNNFNYWFTAADDHDVLSPVARVRHYSLFPDCAPRIRSWRASSTNIRHFNHNPPLGRRCETKFNLRHYPMRSYAQMQRRLTQDRANLERGGLNFHYANMMRHPERLLIAPTALHTDDGQSPLSMHAKFDWWRIYGASGDKARKAPGTEVSA